MDSILSKCDLVFACLLLIVNRYSDQTPNTVDCRRGNSFSECWGEQNFLLKKLKKQIMKVCHMRAHMKRSVSQNPEKPTELVTLVETSATAPHNVTRPDLLDASKVAGIARKDKLRRSCLNECGGLCRQLCAKFKALKVFIQTLTFSLYFFWVYSREHEFCQYPTTVFSPKKKNKTSTM